MNFNLVKQQVLADSNGMPLEDSDGNFVTENVTTSFIAELEDGIFKVFNDDSDQNCIIIEPTNWVNGQKVAWENIEDGIAMFRENNGHIEGE